MKPIGRVLACVLLAAAFAQNAPATSAANLEFATKGNDAVAMYSPSDIQLASSSSRATAAARHPRGSSSPEDGRNEVSRTTLDGARTFGHKRLQFMLMPMMYKMGVMMTLLMVLTAISAKGLLVGLVLLVLKLSAFLSKFHSGWQEHAAPHPWSPSPQPIHVHVHSSYPYAHAQAYSAWEPPSGPSSDQHYYYKG